MYEKINQQLPVVHATPFFKPVVQRQPAVAQPAEVPLDEVLSEAAEAVDDVVKLRETVKQVKKDLCTLAVEILKRNTKTSAGFTKYLPNLLDAFTTVTTYCSRLSSYVRPNSKTIADNSVVKIFEHHRSDDYYGDLKSNERFMQHAWHKTVSDNTAAKTPAEIVNIGGFYLRDKDTINLPSDGTVGSALHETMHRMSAGWFKNATFISDNQGFFNEGATQYFTDLVLDEFGIAKDTGHHYGDHVKFIRKLVSLTGGYDLLAKAYFNAESSAFNDILFQLGITTVKGQATPQAGKKLFDRLK